MASTGYVQCAFGRTFLSKLLIENYIVIKDFVIVLQHGNSLFVFIGFAKIHDMFEMPKLLPNFLYYWLRWTRVLCLSRCAAGRAGFVP